MFSVSIHLPQSTFFLILLSASIRFIQPKALASSLPSASAQDAPPAVNDEPPPGYVKSILPCTPLAIVKCLEFVGVYNKLLPYGDRAYGKTITVINRCVPHSSRFNFPAAA